MQDKGFARSAARMRVMSLRKGRASSRWLKGDVLGVGNDARLDATLFARLGESQLPPRSPRLLVLEPGMFCRAGIIECVDDRLREGFVRRGVANRFCRGCDCRGDGRCRPGYLQERGEKKKGKKEGKKVIRDASESI